MHDTVKRDRQSIAGLPPPAHDWERQGCRHSTTGRPGALVGCPVSPVVQMSKVRYLLRARRLGGLQVQQESKAIEVPLDIVVCRVPFLKRQSRGELRLGRSLEPRGDGRDPDLRAFRVQIAAETLEVGAEVEYEPAKGLVEERRVWRDQGQKRGAMGVHLVQTGHAVILPAGECGGRHQATSTARDHIRILLFWESSCDLTTADRA
jgi:hypothetical protein